MKHIKAYQIFEFVSKVYNWTWKEVSDGDMSTAKFKTDDDVYEVDIFMQSRADDAYMVRMKSMKYDFDGVGSGSSGNVMRVFSTMFDIMTAYLDQYPNAVLQFTGSNDYDNQREPSRRDKIYKYMAENLPEPYKHELMNDGRTIRLWNADGNK